MTKKAIVALGDESGKMSKAAAYREAAAALGETAPLDDVQKFLLDNFSVQMSKGQISAYRSLEKKKTGKSGKRGGKARSAAAIVAPAAAAAPAKTTSSNNSLIEFVSQVRGWENKIGAEQIVQVIQALYYKK